MKSFCKIAAIICWVIVAKSVLFSKQLNNNRNISFIITARTGEELQVSKQFLVSYKINKKNAFFKTLTDDQKVSLADFIMYETLVEEFGDMAVKVPHIDIHTNEKIIRDIAKPCTDAALTKGLIVKKISILSREPEVITE
jgi:hypothetical protein